MYDLNCQSWPVVKMPTTRLQYVGLKEAVLSTQMKVRGCEDIEGRRRWI